MKIMIRKWISSIILLLISHTVFAQLKEVRINSTGEMILTVEIKGAGRIVMDVYGNIIDFIDDETRHVEYYSDFHSYEAGKVKRLDNINFTYYSDFNDYEVGKLKTAGNIRFTYYSAFNDYEKGKIKTIGSTRFTYYSSFHDYEFGKIKSIGTTPIRYYSTFNNYESGKIKNIGSYTYTYFPKSQSGSGKLKSGTRRFTIDGINYWFRDPIF
ncbi:MAG: hypothetical protein ACRDDZ_00475 [Marinifilaceae bacterium]